MAAWMLRHACMSTLPAESICVYWVSAFSCSMVEAPPASMALLNAKAMSVASSRFEVSGASCWTMPVMAELVVGRPSSAFVIFLIEAAASSELYPRFFMTFGKLFIWSARSIALPRLDVTTDATLPNTLEAMPATAPTLAANPTDSPWPMLWPVLLPVVLDASPNAFSMALPTPSMEGTMGTYAVARL